MLRIVKKVENEEFGQDDGTSGDAFPPLSWTDLRGSADGQGVSAQDGAAPHQSSAVTGRGKAVALAALGTGYACTVLAVLSLLLVRTVIFIARAPDPAMVFIICSPMLLGVCALLLGTAEALWIRTPAPSGLEITPDGSPWLFETLKLIGLEIKGPKIHRVLLTGDFQASIFRCPRLGVFGWHRNYLVLGLPLLQSLSARQMLAVIVHEYALMSGRPDYFGSWVYEARESWMQAAEGLAGRKGFRYSLLKRFVRWYAPLFHASSASMARAHELCADRCSADIAGKDQAAAAMIRSEVVVRYLEESFWPTVESFMDDLPEPMPSVYDLMQDKLSKSMDRRKCREWLDKALLQGAGPDETRPGLKERLEALGETPAVPSPPDKSAAQLYFPRLDEMQGRLDEAWRELVTDAWRERYEHVLKARARLAGLMESARAMPLTAVDALELARLIEDLSGSEHAVPFYQRILERMPRFVPALCAVGQICLTRGDESGVDYIEKAMALDPSFSVRGLQALYDFYEGRGDRQKTGEYYQKLIEHKDALDRAQKEPQLRKRLPARYMATVRRVEAQAACRRQS